MKLIFLVAILWLQLVVRTESLSRKLISDVREQIIEKTSPDDLLVFVGKTARKFYLSLKKRRDAITVPLSADHLDKWKVPEAQDEAKFFDEIIKPIIEKALATKKKRIVMVDHSLTGRNVDNFCAILSENCRLCTLSFLNLVTIKQGSQKIEYPKKIYYLGSVRVLSVRKERELFTDEYAPLQSDPHSALIATVQILPQQPSATLSEEALEAIKIGRDQLLDKITENDVLIFIGNSGSYIYHSVKDRHDTYLLPLSGHPVSEAKIWRSVKGDVALYQKNVKYYTFARGKYESLFISPITQSALQFQKRIVLIDASQTGKSVDGFQSMLSAVCPECNSVFLGMLPKSLYDRRGEKIVNPKMLHTIGYLNLPEVCRQFFRDGHFIRLTPRFPIESWPKATGMELMEYEARPEVKTVIDQIVSSLGSRPLVENPSKPRISLKQRINKRLGAFFKK